LTNFPNDKQTQESLESGFLESEFRETNMAQEKFVAQSHLTKKTNNPKQTKNKASNPAVVFLHGFRFNGIPARQFQSPALA